MTAATTTIPKCDDEAVGIVRILNRIKNYYVWSKDHKPLDFQVMGAFRGVLNEVGENSLMCCNFLLLFKQRNKSSTIRPLNSSNFA